jgi:hypothetical protein
MGIYAQSIHGEEEHEAQCPIEGPERAAILRELDSILHSTYFRSSERSKQFLSYVVQHALTGNHERLKERTIGADLFDRPAGYSTGDDPIVRVQAGEVRRRLGQFYQSEGVHSPIHIELHLGSYTPEFNWIQDLQKPAEPHLAPLPELHRQTEVLPEISLPKVPSQEVITIRRVEKSRPLIWASPILGLVLVLAYFLIGADQATAPQSALKQFWAPVFNNSTPVLICLANPPTYRPSPGLYRKYAKNPAAYSTEFARLSQPPPFQPSDKMEWGDMVEYPDFGVAKGDVYAAIRLSTVLATMGKESQVRIGTNYSFEDLRNSPAVVVGAFNNRWTMMMTANLHFAFAEMNGNATILERGGAGRTWSAKTDSNHVVTEDFGVVTRLMNSSTGQFVVILAGIKANGTQAAGEFVSSSGGLEQALRAAPAEWKTKNMQFVLQTTVTDSVNGPPRLVAEYTW